IEHFLLSVMTHVLDATQVVEDRAPPWLISACRMARDPSVLRDGVERFVALAGRSHAHVCRQTQRYFGLSPTQFINRVRIQHAAMLLGKTDRKVQDIAETCGFENMSYFHRQFRQQYGTTPRAFRGNHRRADGD
ncbi:MAG: helix-turn-helix transcriptional regulator, partial [Pseudomonadota bacterium]